MALDQEYDGTATPEELQAVLEVEYCLFVLRGGARYFVCEDEEATGVYVWPDGVDEFARPVARLGESDDQEDWRAPVTYRQVALVLHAWLQAERSDAA